jgi:hypothetical protein
LQNHAFPFPHGGPLPLGKLLGYLALEQATKAQTFNSFIRNFQEKYLTAFANPPHNADSLNLLIIEAFGIIPRALLTEYNGLLLPTMTLMKEKHRQYGKFYAIIVLPRMDLAGWRLSNCFANGILKLIEFIPRVCVEFLDRDEVYPDKTKLKDVFPLTVKENHQYVLMNLETSINELKFRWSTIEFISRELIYASSDIN